MGYLGLTPFWLPGLQVCHDWYFFFVIFYLISKPKHHFFEEKNLIPQWSTYTKASLKDFYMNCLAYATKIDIFFFKKKLLNKYNDKTYIDIDIYKTLYL
jgi:hypothetical protein